MNVVVLYAVEMTTVMFSCLFLYKQLKLLVYYHFVDNESHWCYFGHYTMLLSLFAICDVEGLFAYIYTCSIFSLLIMFYFIFCSSLLYSVVVSPLIKSFILTLFPLFFPQSGQTPHSVIWTLLLHQLRSQPGSLGAHVHTERVPHLAPGDPIYQVNINTHADKTQTCLIFVQFSYKNRL